MRQPNQRVTRLAVVVFLTAIVATGIFFRFYHLSHKVYWDDEVYTSLHLLGITEAEVVRDSSRMVDARALRAIIHPVAVPMRPLAATITSLAVEDPQHPPVYYLLAHAWVGAFGNSVTTVRLLSVLFGIVALPAVYWLCWELFASARASWLAVALLAVSPVNVLFSQEAREFALWSVAILVTSALFLRALRLGSIRAWGLYAVTLAVALYIFPLSIVCALANVVVVVVRNGRGPLRQLFKPLVAHVAAFTLFLPWLFVIVTHLHQIRRTIGAAQAVDRSPMVVAHALFRLIRLDFIDTSGIDRSAIDMTCGLLVATLVGYALALGYRKRRREPWLFVTTLIAVATLPFAGADLIFGTTTTSDVRYFIPLYLAVDLALVSAFVVVFIDRPRPTRRRPQAILAVALGAVMLARVASCALSSQSETWWNKYNEHSIVVARAIDGSANPVLVSNKRLEGSLSLAGYLAPGVALRLQPRCYLCVDSASSTTFDFNMLRHLRPDATVFLLRPSERVQRSLRQRMWSSGRHYFGVDEQTGNIWALDGASASAK